MKMGDGNPFNRRSTDGTNATDSKVRADILEQMSEVEDPGIRVLLGLLIRMQDEMNASFNSHFTTLNAHFIQIHSELSRLQRTEDDIRKIALNGHNTVHDSHHEWVSNQMKLDAACGLVLNKHGADGLCHVARQAIEDEKVAKVRKWKVMDDIVSKAVWVVLGLVAATLFPYIKVL